MDAGDDRIRERVREVVSAVHHIPLDSSGRIDRYKLRRSLTPDQQRAVFGDVRVVEASAPAPATFGAQVMARRARGAPGVSDARILELVPDAPTTIAGRVDRRALTNDQRRRAGLPIKGLGPGALARASSLPREQRKEVAHDVMQPRTEVTPLDYATAFGPPGAAASLIEPVSRESGGQDPAACAAGETPGPSDDRGTKRGRADRPRPSAASATSSSARRSPQAGAGDSLSPPGAGARGRSRPVSRKKRRRRDRLDVFLDGVDRFLARVDRELKSL